VIALIVLGLLALRVLRPGLVAMLIGLLAFVAAVALAFRFDAVQGVGCADPCMARPRPRPESCLTYAGQNCPAPEGVPSPGCRP